MSCALPIVISALGLHHNICVFSFPLFCSGSELLKHPPFSHHPSQLDFLYCRFQSRVERVEAEFVEFVCTEHHRKPFVQGCFLFDMGYRCWSFRLDKKWRVSSPVSLLYWSMVIYKIIQLLLSCIVTCQIFRTNRRADPVWHKQQ